jgi:two-component system NtrC family response regulator
LKPKLLIIDDDDEIRSQMKWALIMDYDLELAEDRQSALEVFKNQRPPVVLLDLGLPPHPGSADEGLAVLSDLLGMQNPARIIVITGQAEKEVALRAIGEGAYDFLCKPIQMEELKIILKRAFYVADLEAQCRKLQSGLSEESFEGMLGTSPQMQDVFVSIRKVASTDAPVLILGESGTGKEMAALAIHRLSSRKDGPFVAINCGAIPESLLESELFGHEKGAFTGAHAQRVGRIETAFGGTLFLDEIGELSLPLQVKLLRFLQEHRIQRIGGRKEIQIDTRVIAATNTELKKAMNQGCFREDLYYRLAVVIINLPPLRQRSDDIPLLAQAFLQKSASETSKGSPTFSQRALRALRQYDWPGNVRELENRVKRAVIMSEGSRVSEIDLELTNTAGSIGADLKEAREKFDRAMVEQALRKHRGKIGPAAADLGISRPTLYELIEKLGVENK